MGGYNADSLLSMYDRNTIFRPFSRELADIIITTRSLKACRDHVLLDDELYLSYLLLLETNIEFAFKNDLAQKKLVQDLIVELQGLLCDGIKYEVSEELTVLTKQLLFKSAADLLAATGSPDEQDLVPILSSLSYQAIDCWVFEQQDISTWSTFLAIDSLTQLLASYPKMINHALWDEVGLGERIVAALLPHDGSIRRLHSDIFQVARQDCESLMPSLNEKLPDVLAERLASKLDDERVLKLFIVVIRRISWIDNEANFDIFHFFRRFVQNQPLSIENLNNYGAASFTSIDFAVFLQWISRWSDITQPGVNLVAKISLSREQILHWKAMVVHIQSSSESPENTARLNTILKTVRLGHGFRNLRLLFGIFQFLLSKKFPTEWPDLYANMILRNMTDYVQYNRDHLFPLPAAIEEVAVDEEGRIHQEVFKFLARQAATNGLFARAASYLEQLSNPAKTILFELYTIYKQWLKVADKKEKAHILVKKNSVRELFEQLSSEPISRPASPSPASTPTKDVSSIHEASPSVLEEEVQAGEVNETINIFDSVQEKPTIIEQEKKHPVEADATVNIFDSVDEEPVPLEQEYQPPTPSFFPGLTEQEEEDYFLMMAEQKLNSTRMMFEMTLHQNETMNIFEQTTIEDMRSRYRKAVMENESLKKELEMERRNKARPMSTIDYHNNTADIFNITAATLPHPDHNGFCLGCMTDDEQDLALHLLKRLADDYNKFG